ncbi:EamA family transporter [Maribacter sp. CXY002]|uniref:EamA family transporter n=1 Tax=Maribacter luteocoastalis TaxID=3407671 RepID=UPI003B683A4C
MYYLLLSVLSSSLIFIVFKLFAKHNVQTFYAIVVNYITASAVGLSLYQGEVQVFEIYTKPWFIGTLCLGVLFILVFNIMAATSQRIGVSAASVATKMSLVIPVIFGVLVYGETLGIIKVLGIALALCAVYFSSVKKNTIRLDKSDLWLPILVFLGSGIIDTSIKYVQEVYVQEEEYPLFTALVFAAAATTGMFYLVIKSSKEPIKVNFKNVLGGIALGVPNYFSIYFLLKALQLTKLNSASIFTINNVFIVIFTTLLGILLFKEKISLKNWIGIIIAIISILLVAFGDDILPFKNPIF